MIAQELAESLMCRNELFIAILKHLAGIPIVSYPGQGGGILANYKLDKKFLFIEELQTILIGLYE